MKPKISVIIPTYNSEAYIHRPLESLINQKFREFEVILVDDGSKDRTPQKAKDILSNAPFEWKLLKLRKHGVGIARNIGIKKARGDFVYFLDSDDYIAKNTLEKLYNSITKSGADIVLCGVDEVTPEGEILRRYSENWYYPPKSVMPGKDVLRLFLKDNIKITVHSALYRKKFLVDHSIYFFPFWGGEDPDFVMRALIHATKVSIIKESLVFYVKDPNKHGNRNIMVPRMFNSLKAIKSSRNYLSLNGAPKDIIELIETKNYPRSILALLKIFIFMNVNYLDDKESVQVKKLIELLAQTKFRIEKKVDSELIYYWTILVLDRVNATISSQKIFTSIYKTYKHLFT